MRKQNIVLMLVSIVVALLLGESILRSLDLPHKIKSGWSWNDSPRRSLAKFDHDLPNEFSLRGQSIKYEKSDYVVLLLGDSHVEAATSYPENMPERLLEKYLGTRLNRPVKVFSLAAAGWGQDQELIALENYYKKYRADLVLVWASPANDFWENAFPDRSLNAIAGHIKPTYKLVGDNKINGPFYKSHFYYKNSAIIQLITMALIKEKTIEQRILDEWIDSLPLPHKIDDKSIGLCAGLTEIDQDEFSKEIFKFTLDERFLIITDEDYLNSRSQFSNFIVNRSSRDNYLVRLTKMLFERLRETATINGSRFFVFFPDQTFSDRYKALAACVQKRGLPNSKMPLELDRPSLLKEVVPSESLIVFDLIGQNELSFSVTDRHLSDIGNERAMNILASMIAHKISKF
jgi:hypothetical protein